MRMPTTAFALAASPVRRSDPALPRRSTWSAAAFGKRLPRELSGGQQQRRDARPGDPAPRCCSSMSRACRARRPAAAVDAGGAAAAQGVTARHRDALYVTTTRPRRWRWPTASSMKTTPGLYGRRHRRRTQEAAADQLHRGVPGRRQPDPVHGRLGDRHLGTRDGRQQDGSAEAPQPAVGKIDWAPGSDALLCIRPHAVQVVSLGNRDAMRANVNAAVAGATTRLVVSVVNGLPDQLVEVDVPATHNSRSAARSASASPSPPESLCRRRGDRAVGTAGRRRPLARHRHGRGPRSGFCRPSRWSLIALYLLLRVFGESADTDTWSRCSVRKPSGLRVFKAPSSRRPRRSAA